MAARIRMKRIGRKNRPFYRICAVNSRSPRDGKVIEEIGHYDPLVPEVDARVTLNQERIAYWLGVGALPSDRVGVFIKKYGPKGTHLEKQKDAIARLSVTRRHKAPTVVTAPAPAAKTEAPAESAS